MTIYYETPILKSKHQVRCGLPTNMRRSVRTDNKTSPGKNTSHLFPPSHQPWFKLGSLLALSGYISQLACQLLIVSGLCLTCSKPLKATNNEFDPQYSNTSLPLNVSITYPSTGFYKDADHPLTLEFWKNKDLSERLEKIKLEIEKLKAEFCNDQGSLINNLNALKDKDRIKRENILKCTEYNDFPRQYLKEVLDLDPNNSRIPPEKNSGCTDANVTLVRRENKNLVAIKEFKDIGKGLEELLYSLMALEVNPAPAKLKMTRIYDVVLYPKNSLSLIMEGANIGDIVSV